MGSCSSRRMMSDTETSKLILEDGELQEFSYPVKVSYLLYQHPSSFICNADEIEFDDFVSAMHGEEELQPGDLYFVLPLSRLRHRFRTVDMSGLAVKASAALMKTNNRTLSNASHTKPRPRLTSNRCPTFTSGLTMIPE